MEFNELVLGLEAVLFASGEPISIQRLAQTFEIEPLEIQNAAKELSKKLEQT